MQRKIINIDEEKCNGCGACAKACHEGAIEMVGGKAKLIRDDYCDGFGDCLPGCPTGAITFTEREAAAYDENAVRQNKLLKMQTEKRKSSVGFSGCPGMKAFTLNKENSANDERGGSGIPRLAQWPCQIKLVHPRAAYFNGAKLLVSADCSAYAFANYHETFMKGRVTLIGCPKLDSVDYSEKLTEIIKNNDIKSITVVRMEVPCCGGLEVAVKKAAEQSGKDINVKVVTISIDGKIL